MVKRTTRDRSSFNTNRFKKSKGFNQVSDDKLETNSFDSKPQTPDEGKRFTDRLAIENRGFGTSLSTLDFANARTEQIQFARVGQSFQERQQFLNRVEGGNISELVSNIASVETPSSASIQKTSNNDENEVNQNSRTDFVGNILDGFENVTYNFRLMVAPEEKLTADSVIPNQELRVIAQSGASSRFNIGDVEVENVVGPNRRTKNTLATTFSVEITEPLGVTFIDQLLATGVELGINNISNAPMILELTFRGYDMEGNKTEVEIAKKSWRITLNDITTTMDEGGARYKLKFSSRDDSGFYRNSSAAIFKEQLSISEKTIGSFFSSLGELLTTQDSVLASNGQQSPHEYEFFVEPEMRDWVIGQSSNEPNTPSMFIDDNERTNVVIEPGKKLEDIVDAVISTTNEIEERANPDSNPEKMDQPQKGKKPSKIALISCIVEFLGFNNQNNEYIKKFNYYISLYDAWRALPDKPVGINQQQRIRSLKETSLKKRYSYYFTGNNTDVLSLDLDLDALWRHATSYYTYSMHRSRNNNSKFLVDDNREKDDPDDLRSNVQQRKTQTNLNKQKSGTDLNLDIIKVSEPDTELANNSGRQDRLLSRRSEDLERRSNGTSTQEIQESISQELQRRNRASEDVPTEDATNDGVGRIGDSSSGRVGGQLSVQETIRVDRNNQRISGGRDTVNRGTTTLSASNLIESKSFKDQSQQILNFFIKHTDPALDTSAVQKNIEETTRYNRSIFGIITNQMYGRTYSNLQQINMEVRGDPYWLGESDIERNRRLRKFNVREQESPNSANYLIGEHSFLLDFRTPTEISENTGLTNLDDQTIFKGIYNVNLVSNVFSQGTFTQTLTAIRDINTDATKVNQ